MDSVNRIATALCIGTVLVSACGSGESGQSGVGRPTASIADMAQAEPEPAPAVDNFAGIPALATEPAVTVMAADISTAQPAVEVDPENCSSVSEVAEPTETPVDIIWVVDASASMLDEQQRITQNLQGFASEISQANIDYRVITLTDRDLAAGTPLAADVDHYLFVPTAVGSYDAWLQVIAQYPFYQSFLRPMASTHIIVVSDDNSLMPAAEFKAQMEALLGNEFTQHAIASESIDGGNTVFSACPGSFAPGLEYYSLAETTKGQSISICTQDWSMVFGPLKEAVIESAPLPCGFAIPAPPTGQSLDPDLVNVDYLSGDTGAAAERMGRVDGPGSCSDVPAWHYDNNESPTAVELCPAICERIAAGGKVDIAFGCKTIILE